MSDPERKPKCIKCGRGEADHLLVNYNDGPFVGAAVLICPTAVFVASTWEFLPSPTALNVGEVIKLRGRSVRVVGNYNGTTPCRDHRDRIGVRNVATGRLSYFNERVLLAARQREVSA